MTADARIRAATPADAAAVRDIYAPFCESTAVTFEETVPTEAEVADRIASTLERHPWLVCEIDGDVVGYAYAGPLRKRRAYEWVVELSVYVADPARGSGVGRALYESLFAVLERQGIRDAYAVTTVPNPETERFHERLGFERLVDFPAIGYTQAEWQDVAWWRRPLAEKTEPPERPRPFPAVREDDDWDTLVRTGEDSLELS
ncbi:GNAT family N-acetyltransferase [Natrinema pallidum]|uniref:Phosphinothricin acetyltransferase n=2 Tax=Natrinema pallidum TaxID=69527 RepID=L9YYJ2_9EURY|nr:GNAT family N-acetyltransferase [Natrinema pallidum]ELY79335.1 Phosphinothricin acetyltransferase [Natrinema pallidum DSM 3751]QCW04763.1 N-acetyltransferase family protein [Natrinema pallidum]